MPTTKQRRICIYCGCKRIVDQMEAIGIKHGRQFQAGKEITGYVCKKPFLPGAKETCLEKWKLEAEKWGSHYHEPVRTGKVS